MLDPENLTRATRDEEKTDNEEQQTHIQKKNSAIRQPVLTLMENTYLETTWKLHHAYYVQHKKAELANLTGRSL